MKQARRMGLALGVVSLIVTLLPQTVLSPRALSYVLWSELDSVPKIENVEAFAGQIPFRSDQPELVDLEREVEKLSSSDIQDFLQNGTVISNASDYPAAKAGMGSCQGVFFTTSGKAYFWKTRSPNCILLITDENEMCALVTLSSHTPAHKPVDSSRLTPPEARSVTAFANTPELMRKWGSRVPRVVIDELLSEDCAISYPSRGDLERLRSRVLGQRLDPILRGMKVTNVIVNIHGLTNSAAGEKQRLWLQGDGALLSNGKIYFWQLLSEELLYLQDEDGVSCLLTRRGSETPNLKKRGGHGGATKGGFVTVGRAY